ncbi:uncharacterized protein LOC120158811 [Hibiscus syriacus]|uniref:uncharacterized protein LOC120158811 n=1 Tax=Hibiscus syriacus TaxID=106335 RepID=UPI00192396F7|nr:uncharacterized protein LOC120158811 [Hibiscus syriacus]
MEPSTSLRWKRRMAIYSRISKALGYHAIPAALVDASILHAELWALLEYLKIAWNGGYRRIDVDLDSQEAVNIFSSPAISFEPAIIRRIWGILQPQWCIRTIHINHEVNHVADALAHLGRTTSKVLSKLNDPPNETQRLLITP